MNEFTLLTKEQIYGDNQLDILKKYGIKCAITDFAILLGGSVTSEYYTSNGTMLKERASWYWTKSNHKNEIYVIHNYGGFDLNKTFIRHGGIRPVLPYSLISSKCLNQITTKNNILEIEYGEYPQDIVSGDFAKILEKAYLEKTIKQTGKVYTTDSYEVVDIDKGFKAREHIEYEYNKRKYIRLVGDKISVAHILSDGRTIEIGNVYWIEVSPIKWMIDEKTNIALSKKIILSGLQFNLEQNYEGNFEQTDIKHFMDTYLSKEIISS